MSDVRKAPEKTKSRSIVQNDRSKNDTHDEHSAPSRRKTKKIGEAVSRLRERRHQSLDLAEPSLDDSDYNGYNESQTSIEDLCARNPVARHIVVGTDLTKEDCSLKNLQRALTELSGYKDKDTEFRKRYEIIQTLFAEIRRKSDEVNNSESDHLVTYARRIGTAIIDQRPEFMHNGNCNGVDLELFFPERGANTKQAKEVCRGCAVREDCLEFALSNGEKFGIWGGLSERQRRIIRRQRRLELIPETTVSD